MSDHAADGSRISPRNAVLVFVASGLVALIVISLGIVVASRRVAESDALRDATSGAGRIAKVVVAPLLGAALDGDEVSRAELDRAVRTRLDEGTEAALVVWRGDGTVVYSGRPADIGRNLPLPAAARTAIELGRESSDFETVPDTGPVVGVSRFVEAYVPLRLSTGPPLALAVYFDYSRVEQHVSELGAQITPIALVALLMLQAVQVPIAVSLARGVRRHVAARAALLRRALNASDTERRTISAGLHDGPVQELHGVVFALMALEPSIDPEVRPVAARVVRTLGGTADSLRRLMIDIYPPDLTGHGLADAVEELAEPLRRAGVTVILDVEPLPPAGTEVVAALYRVARETLANVAKHANARNVLVQLGPDPARPGPGRPGVRLRVVDDGVGAPPGSLDRPPEGHLGLRMLADRVADLGGELTVTGTPDSGTVAAVRLPAGLPKPPRAGGGPTRRRALDAFRELRRRVLRRPPPSPAPSSPAPVSPESGPAGVAERHNGRAVGFDG